MAKLFRSLLTGSSLSLKLNNITRNKRYGKRKNGVIAGKGDPVFEVPANLTAQIQAQNLRRICVSCEAGGFTVDINIPGIRLSVQEPFLFPSRNGGKHIRTLSVVEKTKIFSKYVPDSRWQYCIPLFCHSPVESASLRKPVRNWNAG